MTTTTSSLASLSKVARQNLVLVVPLLLLLLQSPIAVVAFEVPSLDPDNYDEMTHGKTVFIKFFAPWCTFCKRMKADWEQLAEEWDDHAYGLVAEVDCTDEDNGEFCRDQGVTGYPTLKYGDPLDLKEYNGGRSYRALADFAAEHLVAPCSPRYPDECDDQTLELFAKYMDMPVEQLDARIAALEKEHDEADEALEREVLRLKDMYDKLYAEKEAKLAVDQGLSILESIHRVQQAAAVTDEL